MPNRIKGLDGGSIGPSSGNPVERIGLSKPVTPVSAESPQTAAGDSVHITDTARTMAALAQAVQDAPDVDTSRVASVQQQLESGQYTVNPDRIASRLMQLDRDLHATTKNPQSR